MKVILDYIGGQIMHLHWIYPSVLSHMVHLSPQPEKTVSFCTSFSLRRADFKVCESLGILTCLTGRSREIGIPQASNPAWTLTPACSHVASVICLDSYHQPKQGRNSSGRKRNSSRGENSPNAFPCSTRNHRA